MGKYILFVSISIVTVIVLGMYFIFPPIDFSPLENRNMAVFPSLKLSGFVDGTFQTQLEEALKDQLALRDPVIISSNAVKGRTRKYYNAFADFISGAGYFAVNIFKNSESLMANGLHGKEAGVQDTGKGSTAYGVADQPPAASKPSEGDSAMAQQSEADTITNHLTGMSGNTGNQKTESSPASSQPDKVSAAAEPATTPSMTQQPGNTNTSAVPSDSAAASSRQTAGNSTDMPDMPSSAAQLPVTPAPATPRLSITSPSPAQSTQGTSQASPKPEKFWLEPSGSVYKINGGDHLTYYPFLKNISKINNYKIFANQINALAAKHPDIKVYSYYIMKTEDLNWFDTSEKIKTFDYGSYLGSLLSGRVRFGKFEINSYSDLENYLYKTDHHWNHKGGQKGYTQIISMISKDFDISPAKVPLKEQDFGRDIKWYGSKYKSSGGASAEPDSFLVYEYNLGLYHAFYGGEVKDIGLANEYKQGRIDTSLYFDHYVNYYGFESRLIKFQFPKNKYNFLLIGDSNNRPIRKVLGSHFSNFYFIEKRILQNYYVDEFIKANDINMVLFLGESDFWEMYRLKGYPI